MPAQASGDWLAALAGALQVAGEARRLILQPADHPLPAERIPALVLAIGEAPVGVPAIAVSDTIKQVRDGVVVRTLARETLAELKAPWIFRREVLEGAIARARASGWRCAGALDLCRSAGIPVRILPPELAWPPTA